MKQKLVI